MIKKLRSRTDTDIGVANPMQLMKVYVHAGHFCNKYIDAGIFKYAENVDVTLPRQNTAWCSDDNITELSESRLMLQQRADIKVGSQGLFFFKFDYIL